jgi:glutathione peroxidase
MSVHDFTIKHPGGSVRIGDVARGPLLIVNTASKCGFTPQFTGLEALHRKYHPKGLFVVAFPCNQFGGQEPGSDEEIMEFCSLTYDVTFPVMSKIDVNGDDTDPLFAYLKRKRPGLMGSEAIKWNFTKFLVDKNGSVVSRHAPTEKPEALEADIEKLL